MVALLITTDKGEPISTLHITPQEGWGRQLERGLPTIINAIQRGLEAECLDLEIEDTSQDTPSTAPPATELMPMY